MKKKYVIAIIILCLIVGAINWFGIGYYYSGAAAYDLVEELESIYGKEYLGKEVEDGLENMEFVIEPKTFFMTNWNLRNAFSKDYKYECKVIVTTVVEEEVVKVRTITYQAIDPMGWENREVRAHLLKDSLAESTNILVP